MIFCVLIWFINAARAGNAQNDVKSNGNLPDSMMVKLSANNVALTVDRLEKILKSKGITVFLRLDHAKGAQQIGSNLRPTQLIIFGNPKLGSPLMMSNQSVAIDLPLKVVVWQDELGKVWLAYNKPSYLSKRFNLKNRDLIIVKMTSVLNKLTNYAVEK